MEASDSKPPSLSELLQRTINCFHYEAGSKDKRTIIETLITIHRNILKPGEVDHYKQIKISNDTFHNKLWKFESARRFLFLCGWKQVDNVIRFDSDVAVDDIMKVLIQNRDIAPDVSEWDASVKFERINDAQMRDEDLRQKAAVKRKKDLEEFYKEKRQREELTKQIRAEHMADRQRRRYLSSQPGNEVVFGAQAIRTLRH